MKIKTTKWIAVCMVAMMGLYAIGCDNGSNESGGSGYDVPNPDIPGGSSGQFGISDTTVTITVGQTKKLTVTPAGITVAWSSSDEEVATVGADGTVTAVKVGEATITATSGDKSATCTVIVAETVSTNPPSSEGEITLNYTKLTLTQKQTIQLEVTPADANVTWSVGNNKFATVSENGRVSIKKDALYNLGTTADQREVDIFAKTAEGKEAKCAITICDHNYSFNKCKLCEFPQPAIDGHYCTDNRGVFDSWWLDTVKEEVKLPEGVVSINSKAFYSDSGIDTSNFKSVTIPSSMLRIAQDAFYNCENLKDVYYNGTKAEWEEITFVGDTGLSADATIHGYETDGTTETTWKYKEE